LFSPGSIDALPPLWIADAAEAVGLPLDVGHDAVALVASAGMAEVDSYVIVGIDGAATHETSHRFVLDDVELWTWCAYDIVGIAAALSAEATGTTACGYCGKTIYVVIRKGRPDGSSAVGWMPNVTCSNVMAESCPSALLFCSRSHLDEWRNTRPDEVGQALDIESLAELGRSNWAPLVIADAA
jgi:hypothetical protein